MTMESRRIPGQLRYVAITGNMAFVLWIPYNGINEGLGGPRDEVLAYINPVLLLLLNVFTVGRSHSTPELAPPRSAWRPRAHRSAHSGGSHPALSQRGYLSVRLDPAVATDCGLRYMLNVTTGND